MFDQLFGKHSWAFLAVVLTYVVLSVVRPSILVNSSNDQDAPYCLNTLKTTVVLLIVGFAVICFCSMYGQRAHMCGY